MGSSLIQYLDGAREIVWQEPIDGVIEIKGWSYVPGEEPRWYVRRFVQSNVIVGGVRPAHLYIEEAPAKEPSDAISPGGNDWTVPDPKPHGTSGRVDVIHSARTPNKRELRRMKRKERP